MAFRTRADDQRLLAPVVGEVLQEFLADPGFSRPTESAINTPS